ncbi:MAG: Benzil reductase ((S)-benzoin forming) [Syntrophorhabdus sp. PtaU1.Bin050]|nr:MAG: Benzil reductase ((S)-benzoin forming) [Syntrophorhabdus sp. PtaU1.Bin050]
MKYYIVTGSSKGLGKSLATKLIGDDSHVFCISRKKNKKLQETACKATASMDYFEFDLSNPEGLPTLMEEIFNRIERDRAQEICLINNAGMLPPIKAIHETKIEEIKSNITINLIAPVAIIAQFLKLTKNMRISKKVVNISSKASRLPRAQWACYSSSKSGIDTITRTVSLEQNGAEYPARIISFYPGPMDTAMRKENQKTKPLFRRAMEFIRNVLSTKKPLAHHPDFVAERLVAHISSPEFGERLFVSLEDVA